MTPIFSRGKLTDAVLAYLIAGLTPLGILVGDGYAPNAGGWSGGQPGKGDFVPYVVLATGAAQKQSQNPIAAEDASWLATYTLSSLGAERSQTDWTADQARKVLAGYRPRDLDLDGTWNVLQTTFPRLGGVARNDATDPPMWEQVDQVSIWLEAHLT